MRYGFISDIHGRIDLLGRVLKTLENRGLGRDSIVCLGDIVSEHPDDTSNVCLAMLRERVHAAVRGNHDDYALLIRAAHISEESLSYLAGLPQVLELDGLVAVHDNPLLATREGQGYLMRNNYIKTDDDADVAFQGDFQNAIIGHNHRAKVFWQGGSQLMEGGGVFRFDPKKRYIFSTGSVAYSRDKNCLPSCAIYDSEKCTFEIIRPSA